MDSLQLGVSSADAFVNRIVHELHSLERMPDTEEEVRGWQETLLALLRVSSRVERGCSIIKYYILNIFKENWDRLPVEFRLRYDMQFEIFASRETGELSLGTIDNYMRAARIFLQEKSDVFGKVEVPERDETGALILENGKPKTKLVDWNPAEAGISKLVLVAPLAKDGTLKNRPDLLSMVMDSGTTEAQLRAALYGNQGARRSSALQDIYFTLEGPMIVAHRGNDSVEIAEINVVAYEENDLAREALERLFSIFKVKTDGQRFVESYYRRKGVFG